ncbi:hypothetical protein LZ554_001639 [Drepanopeziza brunnea f. sp. 'monogermtubi']|nr:hypothetical protein LZ554_001639 [Drepanopeziza brunnea f. sp. 'monogermtubi']
MYHRRGYVERDSRGRERLFIGQPSSRYRSSSYGHETTQELLDEAEAREQDLTSQVSSLQARLSVAQRDQWHLQNLRTEHQRVVNEHYQCRNMRAQLDAQVRGIARIDNLLAHEEDKSERLHRKNEKLEETIRLLKRGGGESYRARYEEKLLEVELLRTRMVEKGDQLRLAETRIAEKNSTISKPKNFLRAHGL